jgi:photosystem II stability/assembly factor-like uncharacterized protein
MSADGGHTWKQVETVSRRADVGGLQFVDDRTAWVAGGLGNRAFLATTSNAGKTWEFAHVVSDAGNSFLADIQFFGRRNGIAVGGGESGGAPRSLVAITRDGGASWKTSFVQTDDPQPVLKRIVYQSKTRVWATGGKSVYVSEDGGATWNVRHREDDAVDLAGLAVVEGAGVFVTGGWGLVVRSRDFGATWEKQKIPEAASKHYLSSVAFADATHGWVCGDRGMILTTEDGGETWRQEASRRDELLRFIAVIGNQVFAVGDNLTVVRRPL